MSAIHHQLARQSSEFILLCVQNGNWKITGLDPAQTRYGRVSGASWPQPDGVLVNDADNITLALEFKPPSETKRGCLTGLGQTLAYLSGYSSAITVLPETVEGFEIAKFVSDLCDGLDLGNVPIGVASYSLSDVGTGSLPLKLLRKVPNITLNPASISINSTYWANWRDTSPSVIFTLLKISDEILSNSGTISQAAIWDEFWDSYFNIGGADKTLNETPSKVKIFNGSAFVSAHEKTKQRLRKKVSKGEMTQSDALDKLEERTSKTVTDSSYDGLRKNHFNFINQIGLWDSTGRLTESGWNLLHTGKIFSPDSPAFHDSLSKILLKEGGHLDLIVDFEEMNENLSRGKVKGITNSESMRRTVWGDLDKRGLVKRNPLRKTTGAKKSFQDEVTLWGHLGLIKRKGSTYFFPNRGFLFDWAKIISLMSS